jgi:hypothetical protein
MKFAAPLFVASVLAVSALAASVPEVEVERYAVMYGTLYHGRSLTYPQP